MIGSDTTEAHFPTRQGRRPLLLGVFAVTALTGCHHRRVQPVVLPPQTPVALLQLPEPDAPLVPSQTPKLPAVPVAQAAEKPKKAKKRPSKPIPVPAPQQVATNVPAAAKKPVDAANATPPKPDTPVVSIGALTVGGEQSPRALQEANELLVANDRRLNAISADTLKSQTELVGKVKNFQKDAQLALGSGDAEGAKTLATKGKLLLDDLDKSEVK